MADEQSVGKALKALRKELREKLNEVNAKLNYLIQRRRFRRDNGHDSDSSLSDFID